MDVYEMKVEDVKDFITTNFDNELAECFENQNIDGKALVMLAQKGTQQQFEACGLITVGKQLQFRASVEEKLSGSAVVKMASAEFRGGKPTKTKLRSLSEIEQKLYKFKKKIVRSAAIKTFPGNNLPNFKLSKEAKQKLEALASSLVVECGYEPAGFGREGIKQHIIDVLNERRRNHRKGRDYNQPDKRTLKRKVSSDDDVSSLRGVESTTSTSSDGLLITRPVKPAKRTSTRTDVSGSSDDDSPTDSNLASASSTPKNVIYTDDELPQLPKWPCNSEDPDSLNVQNDRDLRKKEMENDDVAQEQSSEAMMVENVDSNDEIKGKDAAVVVCVAFNAIKVGDVSRSQLYSAAKLLGVAKNARKDKDSLVSLIGNNLVKEGYVKIDAGGKNVISQENVKMVKPF